MMNWIEDKPREQSTLRIKDLTIGEWFVFCEGGLKPSNLHLKITESEFLEAHKKSTYEINSFEHDAISRVTFDCNNLCYLEIRQ